MINQISIAGHVGSKPKVNVFKSGKKVARFSIAVNQFARGEKQDEPLWLDIEAWEKVAELVVKNNLAAGNRIVVSGFLAPNVYTQGTGDQAYEVRKVKVKLSSFVLMSGPQGPAYDTLQADPTEEMTVHEPSEHGPIKTTRIAKRSAA